MHRSRRRATHMVLAVPFGGPVMWSVRWLSCNVSSTEISSRDFIVNAFAIGE
jgi:hypothetical protein